MSWKKATWTLNGAKVRGPEKKHRRKYLRRKGTAQAKLDAKWKMVRETLLKGRFMCECHCGRRAAEVHHKKGRGKYLLVIDFLMAVCHQCHDKIHRNPAWAAAKGYMASRLAKV